MAADACVTAPLVIAHRGASGHLPEHTLEAYMLAMRMGADFIEPDLVPTKDGQLISRHENDLTHTTNVAVVPQFADRKTTKRIDGIPITGWFSEDFTLAEIKQLKAREPLSALRPQGAEHNDKFDIVTLAEIVGLVKQFEADTGRKVGLYIETKHPTYFRYEGKRIAGAPIALDISKMLVQQLQQLRFTEPSRVFIQSFEVQNLLELKQQLMPALKLKIPLIQLIGDTEKAYLPPQDSFSVPYDVFYHQQQSADLASIYKGSSFVALESKPLDYSVLLNDKGLNFIQNYAAGIGPWRSSIYQKHSLNLKPFVKAAQQQGLKVHPYTFRAEANYLMPKDEKTTFSYNQEMQALFKQGIDGLFTDYPDLALEQRALFQQSCKL
ncbi:glycerophosphodiester phosphodiesterase [Rheinheimera sediminis]|nr:glycerophosphodiester phosphodiesterase [Rheinheimera sp. YQF-1]